MSTSPVIPQQLMLQLDEQIKNQGVQPPPLPQNQPPQTLKFGDVEVPYNDPAAIQQAFEQMQERMKREAEGWKQVAEQKRYVPNEGQPPQQQQQPNLPQPQSSKWSADEWAKMVMVDPVEAQALATAKHLGLPEGTSLKQVLTALAMESAQLKQQFAESQKSSQAHQADLEAERFLRDNPDYEAKDENKAVIDSYLQTYGLPANQKGYEAAFALAKTHDKIKVKAKPQAQAQTQDYVPDPSQARVASLRNTQSNTEPNDWVSLQAKLDKLPTDEVFKFTRNLYSPNQ